MRESEEIRGDGREGIRDRQEEEGRGAERECWMERDGIGTE